MVTNLKEFDSIDHPLLFRKLLRKKLPVPISVRILQSCYCIQSFKIYSGEMCSFGLSMWQWCETGRYTFASIFSVFIDDQWDDNTVM